MIILKDQVKSSLNLACELGQPLMIEKVMASGGEVSDGLLKISFDRLIKTEYGKGTETYLYKQI